MIKAPSKGQCRKSNESSATLQGTGPCWPRAWHPELSGGLYQVQSKLGLHKPQRAVIVRDDIRACLSSSGGHLEPHSSSSRHHVRAQVQARGQLVACTG